MHFAYLNKYKAENVMFYIDMYCKIRKIKKIRKVKTISTLCEKYSMNKYEGMKHRNGYVFIFILICFAKEKKGKDFHIK